jgi:hypothetical protein
MLRARVAAMAQRVQRLGRKPHHPFTASQIAAVELEVANLRTLLTDTPRPFDSRERDLARVAQLLDAAAQRIDQIEELLVRSPERS